MFPLFLALCPAAPAPLPRPVTAADVCRCDRMEWAGYEYGVRFDPSGACRLWRGPYVYHGRWSFRDGVLRAADWAEDEPERVPCRWFAPLRRTPAGLVGEGDIRVRLWRAR